jgi:hypothetical protein
MATLAHIADRAQNALNDAGAATWAQATVEEWVLEAIRDYSTHFHRIRTDDISTVADQHNYDLNEDFVGVLRVEYPVGEDPPQYLKRMDHRHPDFFSHGNRYDIQPATGGSRTAGGVLWISDEPDGVDTIQVLYNADHDTSLGSSDSITVPDHHEHLLILFVVWKALAELVATEAQSPDTTIDLLNQLRAQAQAARGDYETHLRRTVEQQSDGGWAGPWPVDKYDRIY